MTDSARSMAMRDCPSPGSCALLGLNVVDFGADSSGRMDSYAAFDAAISALPPGGGTVRVPSGSYLLTRTLIIDRSGVSLRGGGLAATKLVGSAGVPAIIQEGTLSQHVVNNDIEDLTVTRAEGPIPDNSVSIDWENFNYGFELNTKAEGSFYGRSWTSPAETSVSVGYRGVHTLAANVTGAYAHFVNAADIFIDSSEFGQNGGERYDPKYVVEISGNANDVCISNSVLIPRGPGINKPTLLGFSAYKNSTGIVRLINVTSENTNFFLSSDSQTPFITELMISDSRISVATAFSNMSSSTRLQFSSFSGNSFGGGVFNITSPLRVSNTGGFLQALNVTGSSPQDSLSISGVQLGNVDFSGTFESLIYVGNNRVAGSRLIDNSIARNKIIDDGWTLHQQN